MIIDTSFDFRKDAKGKDPDISSPMLKAYQRVLYSKSLPNGEEMQLDEKLRWKDFRFSSDSILHSFASWECYQHIISQIDESILAEYRANSYYIGGEIIFPSYRVPGVMTINQARGCNQKIRDRIDLTLECIRRYYQGEDSPLNKCFCGYESFFDLFVDFEGYVDYFHLQDLVTSDYSEVKFLTWFDDFNSCFPLPRTVEEYVEYIGNVLQFSKARNKRIDAWCQSHCNRDM